MYINTRKMSNDESYPAGLFLFLTCGAIVVFNIKSFHMGESLFSKNVSFLYFTPLITSLMAICTLICLIIIFNLFEPGKTFRRKLSKRKRIKNQIKESKNNSINRYRRVPLISSDFISSQNIVGSLIISIGFCAFFFLGHSQIAEEYNMSIILLTQSTAIYFIIFMAFELSLQKIMSNPNSRYIYDEGEKLIIYRHEEIEEIYKKDIDDIETEKFSITLKTNHELFKLYSLNPKKLEMSIAATKI